MTTTTANGAAILGPEQVGPLLIEPVMTTSIAAQVANAIQTDAHTFRIPVLSADPSAAWVAEGAEITPEDPTLDEDEITPAKLAGLTIISSELAEDSSEEAAQVIGAGLVRDISRKLDAAFFGAESSPAPSGLGALAGVSAVDAPTAWADEDPFLDGIAAAEDVYSPLTAWVTSSAEATSLAKLKTASGWNTPLLPTLAPGGPARLTVAGLPVYVSPAVASGVVFGISKPQTFVVVRRDAQVVTDSSVFFTSDRVAIRATMRVGFGFPHAAAVVKITRAA